MVLRIKWRKGSFLIICTILQIDCILALFCWDCREISNPEDCTDPIECGQDEVCRITEFRMNDQIRYNLSCVHHTDCDINPDAASAAPSLVGKRSVQRRELMCSDCCSTDTCNVKCNKTTVGGWTEWTPWSECTVTCRGGTRMRHRSCVNQPPGQDCLGSKIETEHCNSIVCSGHVDGGWGSWGVWTPCSKSCDMGSKFRLRKCDNPIPRNNGSDCQGNATDTADCHLQPCPVDGGWSSWTLWSSCSGTCGPGIKVRDRLCNNPNPAYNGSTCRGHTTENTTCNVTSCPVDGNWSPWSPWFACNVTCGTGVRMRVHTCSNPAPENLGRPCSNPMSSIEFQACNTSPCPVAVADCRDKIQLCSDPSSLGTICADQGIAAEFCPISCKICEKHADMQQQCQDTPEGRCHEPDTQQLLCDDPYKARLCSRTCQLC